MAFKPNPTAYLGLHQQGVEYNVDGSVKTPGQFGGTDAGSNTPDVWERRQDDNGIWWRVPGWFDKNHNITWGSSIVRADTQEEPIKAEPKPLGITQEDWDASEKNPELRDRLRKWSKDQLTDPSKKPILGKDPDYDWKWNANNERWTLVEVEQKAEADPWKGIEAPPGVPLKLWRESDTQGKQTWYDWSEKELTDFSKEPDAKYFPLSPDYKWEQNPNSRIWNQVKVPAVETPDQTGTSLNEEAEYSPDKSQYRTYVTTRDKTGKVSQQYTSDWKPTPKEPETPAEKLARENAASDRAIRQAQLDQQAQQDWYNMRANPRNLPLLNFLNSLNVMPSESNPSGMVGENYAPVTTAPVDIQKAIQYGRQVGGVDIVGVPSGSARIGTAPNGSPLSISSSASTLSPEELARMYAGFGMTPPNLAGGNPSGTNTIQQAAQYSTTPLTPEQIEESRRPTEQEWAAMDPLQKKAKLAYLSKYGMPTLDPTSGASTGWLENQITNYSNVIRNVPATYDSGGATAGMAGSGDAQRGRALAQDAERRKQATISEDIARSTGRRRY